MANKVPPTNANVVRAVAKSLSADVANHIPDNASDTLHEVFDDMFNYAPRRNELVPALVERIGLQTVESMAWRNPLARFKKDPLRYGATHEETYINMAQAQEYDAKADYELAFRQYQSYIMSVFHEINLKLQYPVTVTFDNIRDAFLTPTGIRDMISAKMESAVTAANWDEYLAMRGLIDTAYEKELVPVAHVDEVTNKDTANTLLAAIKQAVGEFAFPNPANNIAGATSSSKPSNLIWLTTPKVNAQISVEALAYAFNMDKADVDVQTVIVDKFEHASIQGVLVDVRFFNVREQIKELSDQRLANVLSWNYFYTMWEMISASPFYPIRVFTTDTVATTLTLTVNPMYTPTSDVEGRDKGACIAINNIPKYELTGIAGTFIDVSKYLYVSSSAGYAPKNVRYTITQQSSTLTGFYVLPGSSLVYIPNDYSDSGDLAKLTINVEPLSDDITLSGKPTEVTPKGAMFVNVAV